MGNRNNDEDYNRLRRTKDYQYEEKNEEEYRGPVGVNNDEPRALSSDPNSSSLRSVNSDVPVKGLQSVANAEEYESRKRKRSNPTQTPGMEKELAPSKEAEADKETAGHPNKPEEPTDESGMNPEDSQKGKQEEEGDALSKMVKAFKQKEKEEKKNSMPTCALLNMLFQLPISQTYKPI